MRTLNEIKQSIQDDFINSITLRELYGLEPADTFADRFSPASIEAVIIHVIALAVCLYEKMVDGHKNDLSAQIASEYPFSIAWYYRKLKEFQLGNSLEFNDATFKFEYPAMAGDTENSAQERRIIHHAAIRQVVNNGVTTLKVYAAGANRRKLTNDEFEAFKSYVRQTGAAGTHFEFVPPMDIDRLYLKYTVWRNPQVLDSSGNLLSGDSRPVTAAVMNYIDNIKYGGAFSRTKSMDAVQAVGGVVDVVLADVKLNGSEVSAQSFESSSGFFNATVDIEYLAVYES
jgi:hypothetical protein